MHDEDSPGIDRTVPYDRLPEFLTPDELRAYLGLSRNGVYALLQRDEIPHVRFGRLIRIPKTALATRGRSCSR